MINKKSYFLGVGTGIIVACSILFFSYSFDYASNETENIVMSEEEIVTSARKLGMIFIKEAPDSIPSGQQQDNINEQNNNNENNINVESKEEVVLIEIEEGYSSYAISNLLEQHGVIDNADEFNKFIEQNDATKKLRYGSIYFTKNMDFNDILNMIIAGNSVN